MLVYDFETLRILAVNQAAVVRYGYSEQEFLALTIRDIRPPQDQVRLEEELKARPDEGAERTGVRHRTKDGRVLDVYRSEERRVGKSVDLGGRRTTKRKRE